MKELSKSLGAYVNKRRRSNRKWSDARVSNPEKEGSLVALAQMGDSSKG